MNSIASRVSSMVVSLHKKPILVLVLVLQTSIATCGWFVISKGWKKRSWRWHLNMTENPRFWKFWIIIPAACGLHKLFSHVYCRHKYGLIDRLIDWLIDWLIYDIRMLNVYIYIDSGGCQASTRQVPSVPGCLRTHFHRPSEVRRSLWILESQLPQRIEMRRPAASGRRLSPQKALGRHLTTPSEIIVGLINGLL